MVNEAVEHVYFNWLCAKVVKTNDSRPPFWKLFTHLQRTEFVWVVFMDENRAMDGKELRREFILQAEMPDDPEWRIVLGCSVLEMLIGFARRANWEDDAQSVAEWFWEFLHNLGLDQFNDHNFDVYAVDDILQTFIWRTYPPNGVGGLFPIDNPISDQRETEVWYQFCEYLVDHDRLP